MATMDPKVFHDFITRQDIAKAMNIPYSTNGFFKLMLRRFPDVVFYHGGKVDYFSPNKPVFVIRNPPPSPSDCVWIVPGTGDRS